MAPPTRRPLGRQLYLKAVFVALYLAGALGGYVLLAQASAWRTATAAGEATADCYRGGETAHWIYLHGLDSFGPSWQEQLNRDELRALADANGATIAMPRGNGTLAGARAWQLGAELPQTAALIERAAATCMDISRGYTLIGFSNGGYAAGELWAYEMLPNAVRMVTVGGGPPFWQAKPTRLPSRPLDVLVGRGDARNAPHATANATRWQQWGASVFTAVYAGGHRLKADAFSPGTRQITEHAATARLARLWWVIALAIVAWYLAWRSWHALPVGRINAAMLALAGGTYAGLGTQPGALMTSITTFAVVAILLCLLPTLWLRQPQLGAVVRWLVANVCLGAAMTLMVIAFFL